MTYRIQRIEIHSTVISLGRSLIGSWFSCYRTQTGSAGESNALSIWGNNYPTRKQAIIAGLEAILHYHHKARVSNAKHKDSCGNYDAKTSTLVVKKCNEMLKNLIQGKVEQLTFFN